MDKEKILKGQFQPEERLLLAKVLDQADFCFRRQRPAFTDFLDPAGAALCQRVLPGRVDVPFLLWGGREEAERPMLGFFPDYREPAAEEFPIGILQVESDGRFSAPLSHRDYLGAVLGLGLTRDKLGDIVTGPDVAWCFVHRDVAEFVQENLTQVGRRRVRVTVAPGPEALPPPELETRVVTVASLRLDAVVAELFRLSRGKAKDLILAEKVTQNWRVATDPAAGVAEGDTIAARGFGRGKVLQSLGSTKKDRWRIELGVYK